MHSNVWRWFLRTCLQAFCMGRQLRDELLDEPHRLDRGQSLLSLLFGAKWPPRISPLRAQNVRKKLLSSMFSLLGPGIKLEKDPANLKGLSEISALSG